MDIKKCDRKAFNFMKSFYDAIETLPKKKQPLIYEAIVKYSFDDEFEPNFTGQLLTVWLLIKPILDKSFTNYKNAMSKQKDE